MNVLVILQTFFLIFSICSSEDFIVKIDQGSLNGTLQYDRKGNRFYSFRSIPFAKPPVGELRFKDPQPAESWNNILNATEDLPYCYQVDFYGNIRGQEDCLYLNIYTPELSSANSTLKHVMVFIHGGAYTEGSGRQELYGPQFLLPQDIVLVTTNYRLGIFGFFSLDDHSSEILGNAGLKDQVMALTWIQKNIEKFGGNPQSVTIFGESAGGASVHYLILSSLAKGLFHRAIIQSGTAISSWALTTSNNGESLAGALNIPTDDIPVMLASLRGLQSAELFAGQAKAKLYYGTNTAPVVEMQTDGTAFLTEDPVTLIKKGQYNNVDVMIGYNDAEGIAIDQAVRALLGFSVVVTDFFTTIPQDLNIANGTREAAELSYAIKNFYYGDSEPTIIDMKPFIQLYTDLEFGYPAYRAVVEHLKTSTSAIYFYRFSADTLLNVYKRRINTTATYKGASHGDDLGYLFYSNTTLDIQDYSLEDLAIDRVVKLWTNFAKYGTPTPDSFTDFKWLPVTEDIFHYAEIGTNMSILGVDPDPENMKFWSGVYEKYYKSSAGRSFVSSIVFILQFYLVYAGSII